MGPNRLKLMTLTLLTISILIASCGGDPEAASDSATSATDSAAGSSRSAVDDKGQFTSVASPQLTAVRDQSKALAETAPEGAAISGAQAVAAVQEYLANHKLAFCKARANEPGWLTKYFGSGTWEVALSADYDPWGPDSDRGAVKPRLWRIENDSALEVVSLNENWPC
ncbi:MAG: hypothetical protein FI680_03590 [SAR202 cluster bacterium]|nr:hypothetical protein [SAR202 cluster bacterium]